RPADSSLDRVQPIGIAAYWLDAVERRICRARVRMEFSRSRPVLGSTGASTHWPLPSRVWRNTVTRTPSARNSRLRMRMLTLNRSLGVPRGLYQSVMMVPPNGSAEAIGMNDIVSSEACYFYDFTATTETPPPPSPFL